MTVEGGAAYELLNNMDYRAWHVTPWVFNIYSIYVFLYGLKNYTPHIFCNVQTKNYSLLVLFL